MGELFKRDFLIFFFSFLRANIIETEAQKVIHKG